ncbi:MAG: phospholipase D family protein [Anaerolineae bacterium]|nr:phospholipase D family protein [Anaerolineae bacterium]
MRVILQPFSDEKLGTLLNRELEATTGYSSFQAAVAFLKMSGMQHIQSALQTFIDREGYIRMVVGIDQYGTSFEALQTLLAIIGNRGEIWINYDTRQYITFHPKLYLFEGTEQTLLVLGSGNLTEGGLFTNDEASSINLLLPSNPEDLSVIQEVKAAIDNWCMADEANTRKLDEELLHKLLEGDLLRTESQIRLATVEAERTDVFPTAQEKTSEKLFGPGTVTRARPRRLRPIKQGRKETEDTTIISIEALSGFVMLLTRTDVGVGQTTSGTSRRSPELFIPLAARNAQPQFWGWPDKFVEQRTASGNTLDSRSDVAVRLATENTSINMMCWRQKSDFRLRSERLRRAGQEGDILRIEKMRDTSNFEYYIEVIPHGTSLYDEYLALCTNDVRNSSKKWGFYEAD